MRSAQLGDVVMTATAARVSGRDVMGLPRRAVAAAVRVGVGEIHRADHEEGRR